jgi:Zn-finger nucleic acid-binding protein
MSPEPYRGGTGLAGSPGGCPRCPGTPLEPRTAGQLRVAMCRTCRGIWIGEAGFIDAFFAADADLARLARADAATTPSPVASGAASCPTCGEVMEAQGGATGITVDVCSRHGIWLDAGELGALLGVAEPSQAGLLDRVARWIMGDRS